MSPSMKSKSKSKEKGSANTSKEQQKGTFQTTETSLVASSAQVHENNHFPKTYDTDEHSSSHQGTVSEYDSVSNNGSCSGESEDAKEKTTNSSTRPDITPGCDNDRRDKIRLKNERKHQRQRERRAQELRDRCGGYLMLRKLEALAQKLVSMGFSSERASLALKLNDGKLEESISWLIEGNEEESQSKDTTDPVNEGSLKIDISEELVQISALGVKYNCSNQEVERVVVACEGDLQKAENSLKSQKLESHVTQPKSEDSAQNNSLMSSQSQGFPAASVSMQKRGNESDFNYYNVGGAENRNLQSLHLNHSNELTEKRWGVAGSNPCTMLNMAQSMEALSPSVRNEGRMIQGGVRREALVTMQHPQFTNAKQNSQISNNFLPSGTSGWYVNSTPLVENVRSNGKLLDTHSIGNVGRNHLEQLCQAPYKGGFYNPMGASSPSPSTSSQHQKGLWSNSAYSLEPTVPSPFGLVSGHQNAARTFSSFSHADQNAVCLMPEVDYNSIDWSLDCPASSKSGGLWPSLLTNSYGNRMGSSYIAGLQNVGMAREASSSNGLREWTSPFAGKDMFSAPRQFVTSPSLL